MEGTAAANSGSLTDYLIAHATRVAPHPAFIRPREFISADLHPSETGDDVTKSDVEPDHSAKSPSASEKPFQPCPKSSPNRGDDSIGNDRKAGSATADVDAGQATPAAANREFWVARLDDAARAAFERQAATADRRGQLFRELRRLSDEAKAGNENAMGMIQSLLCGNEDFWRTYGDAGILTESILIGAISCDVVAVAESVRRNVLDMKQRLLGCNSSLFEELAVGRVIASWLFLQFIDRSVVAAVQHGSRASDLARLQESAEKRYHTALRTLEKVRGAKLLVDRPTSSTTEISGEGAFSAA